MSCSGGRCGGRATDVVDLGDGVLRPACERCATGACLFYPNATRRRLRSARRTRHARRA